MMAVMLGYCSVILLIIGHLTGSYAEDVSVIVGDEALLSCPVSSSCGLLHSLGWYRDNQRIALVSELANITKKDGPMSNRIHLSLSVPRELRITPVEIDDSDMYKCEITYINPSDSCSSGATYNLITLMKPTSLVIVDQAGNELKEGSALGGLLEDSEINISCRAKGGKPTPELRWTVADDQITGDQEVVGEREDAITTNRLFLQVERKYQGKILKCSASSPALVTPMYVNLQMDLILLPKGIEISGIEHHVVQGSKVTLECKTTGSRPPPAVNWYNGTQLIPAENALTTTELQSDGTYTTLSRLSFWATRWENGQVFTCEARQLAAPKEQDDAVLNATHHMDVHFPPVVTVSPENITVNETTDVLLFCKYESNPTKLLSIKWIHDKELLDLSTSPDHYEGGNLVEQALLIKNSSEEDIGQYFCHLENAVGSSTSENSVFVDIQFKPEVQLMADVEDFVIETDNQNVTLECGVVKGNPSVLRSVKWFLDGELLQELPMCEDDSDDLCSGVEISKLLLESVARTFHGNYSCQGENDAGWGPISNDTELVVYYVPGPAKLVYYPQNVIKGMSVKLVCSVDDLGRPQAVKYQWYRGSQLMTEIETQEWLVDSVGLESETNFTCRAVNDAGLGDPAIVYVEVSAPPAFIQSMNPTTGIVYNASDVSLECRVECSPLCGISWLTNGWPINTTGSGTDLYTVVETALAPDSRINSFESTFSKLIFNLNTWPDGVLDRLSNKTNYTCVSKENGFGPSVNSTTYIVVEYPPENMTVSNKVVSVNEDHVPEKVICNAKGKPEPSYVWVRYNMTKAKQTDDGKKSNGNSSDVNGSSGSAREVLSKGHVLVLKKGVKRSESGDLVCEATNKHGTVSITTYLNVQYKPSCEITQTEINEEKVAICNVNANPNDVSFDWSLKDENDTIDEAAITNRDSHSTLKLDMLSSVDGNRVIVCVVNNTVGVSEPCMLTIQGFVPWWKFLSRTALMIMVGVCILLLIAILLCCIIMCICRRRRKAKYGSAVPEDGMCISPQNESSIVQAIVSQSLSPKVCVPTTPIQYSEKTRLVPQGQMIMSQGKNMNPLALSANTGRLQADLSQLEASYQASLHAKQLGRSNLSLNTSNSLCNDQKQNQSNMPYSALAKDIIRMTNEDLNKINDSTTNNNNDISVNDNETSKDRNISNTTITSNKSPMITTGNKWPLKPGVLVHVNSNHSLSPKRLARLINKQEGGGNGENEGDGKGGQGDRETEASRLGILERDDIVREVGNDEGNRNTCQNSKFDKDKCKNLLKTKTKKRSKLRKLFKRFDILRMSKGLMSDEDECISDSDRDGSKRVKRTKSNKRALSLVGFTLKDDTEQGTERSRSRLRHCLEGSPVVVVPTEGVVSFRRPPKPVEESHSTSAVGNSNTVTNSVNTNNNINQSDSLNDSNQSRSSTNSRKRKKPGEAPMNGVGNGEDAGVDNPGAYENLPFHGLQQVPNKPVQVIRPRVVRALIGQTSAKSPEAVLEKQLECNPSFVPRVLTCPPFSHNPPHVSLTNLAQSNSSSINTLVPSASTQTLTPSLQDQKSLIENKHSYQFSSQSNMTMFNGNLDQIDGDIESGDESDQKFHSLNLKKDHRQEPQFSSMKMMRKRKTDKTFPHHNPQKIDYILIKKNDKLFKQNIGGKSEIVYANFSGLINPSLSTPEMSARDNSLVMESMNASYQNLTDSIQIYENSPVHVHNFERLNTLDSKTPTPAPRSIKSPVKNIETPTRKSPRDHVYANMASQIGLLCEANIGIPILDDSQKVNLQNNKVHKSHSLKLDRDIDLNISGFRPLHLSSKVLSKSIDRQNSCLVDSESKRDAQFMSLPKRTSKSGILMDDSEDEKKSTTSHTKESRIRSSKSPSRNNLFDNSKNNKNASQDELSNRTEEAKHKITPSVVDATPKIKPFMVNQQGYNTFLSGHTPYKFGSNVKHAPSFKGHQTPIRKMDLKFGSNTEKMFEKIDKSVEQKANSNVRKMLEADHRANFIAASKVFENKINNYAAAGKSIPKQNMIIQPDKTPLQIPKLLPKPIPKMNQEQRVAVRRSQSSVSSKGINYRQQFKETANPNDGSLVRAKIRELNLRQNTNFVGNHVNSKQSLNQTHPNIVKPARVSLQKHHSFCYFQPIKSAKENENEFTILDKDDDSTDETSGPLIYKPHTKKIHSNECYNESTNNLTNHSIETSRYIDTINKINANLIRNDNSITNLDESRFKNTNEISPEHRESMNKLHELLKRDSERHKVSKKPSMTYKVGAMNHHKYVPNTDTENTTNTLQQKRLVYADLDLEVPKDNINSTNKLTSSEQSGDSFRNVQRTPYATLKFDDVTV